MRTDKIIYVNLFVFSIIYISMSSNVQLKVPKLIENGVFYKLIINNPKVGQKFPVEDFVFAFELLLTLNPRKVLSVGDVTTTSFTKDEYRGFSISDTVFNKDSINMNIQFRREAHGTVFRIRYTSAKTDNDKEAFFNVNAEQHIIFEKPIKMYIPHKITILISPEINEVTDASDRKVIGQALLPDRYGQISCQVTEGVHNAFPNFGATSFLTGSKVTIVNNNTIKLIWMVRLKDHDKFIECLVDENTKKEAINVYHYMTEVSTSPTIINQRLYRDTQVKCIGKNGYPAAKSKWVFVKGPLNARYYYELRDENATLVMNFSTPLYSNWTFSCEGSSQMNPVVAKYILTSPPSYPVRQTYYFTIVDASKSRRIVKAVLITILVTFILSVMIAIIIKRSTLIKCYRDKIKRSSIENQKKTTEKPNKDKGKK